MHIAHISDSHLSDTHPHRADDLQACVVSINALAVQPDVVVHTGDIAHNALEEEYLAARNILDQLRMPWYVMVGNKDKREQVKNVFADDLSIHTDDEFIQYSVEQFPIRLIMLDTLSDESNKGQLCKARLAHLEQMLGADESRPVSVFMHHSPFEVAAIPDPLQFEDWGQVDELAAILARHANVTGIFCGHIHRSIDGQLGDLPVSAISCMATDLRKGKLSHNEKTAPMFAVHELHA